MATQSQFQENLVVHIVLTYENNCAGEYAAKFHAAGYERGFQRQYRKGLDCLRIKVQGVHSVAPTERPERSRKSTHRIYMA